MGSDPPCPSSYNARLPSPGTHGTCPGRPDPEDRFRQPRLPESACRFRTHPHPAQGRGLRDRAHVRRGRCRGGQYLRLHRLRRAGITGRHRRGVARERQGDRYRLSRQAVGTDPRELSGRARDHRSAGLQQRDECRPHGAATHAQQVPRPRARHGREAHAEALRVPEDFRRLQPPLQLLHHPVDARRPRQPSRRPGAARSRAPGEGRCERVAGDLAGHQRLWRGRPLCRARVARQGLPHAHDGTLPGSFRTRRVDPPALRVSVSAR